MQQTKFDRWLKDCFIYETNVFTLRLPEEKLPWGVKIYELDRDKVGDYNYKLVIKSSKKAEQVIAQLKGEHLMHATRVVEAGHWYNGMLAPKGQSFTYRWIIRFLGAITLFYIGWGIYLLYRDASFMQTIRETIEDLKGGSI